MAITTRSSIKVNACFIPFSEALGLTVAKRIQAVKRKTLKKAGKTLNLRPHPFAEPYLSRSVARRPHNPEQAHGAPMVTMKSPVEVVLINWKRPENVAAIVEAMIAQTVPCTLTVCDCHPSPEFALSCETLSKVDRVYRWTHNLGAYSRYVPMAAFDHPYTYLPDDDILPGSRCLEHFLDHARWDEFGVLGQDGRRLKSDGIYRTARVERTRRFEEVDLVVRAYFVKTKNLAHVASLRWDMGLQGTTDAEDDILLAAAMRLKASLGSYLTPKSGDEETSVMKERLPSPHALSDRADHLQRRTDLLGRLGQMGWQSYASRRGPTLTWALRGRLR